MTIETRRLRRIRIAANEMYPNPFWITIASHGMYGGDTILCSFPFLIFNPSCTIDRETFSVKNRVCMEKDSGFYGEKGYCLACGMTGKSIARRSERDGCLSCFAVLSNHNPTRFRAMVLLSTSLP